MLDYYPPEQARQIKLFGIGLGTVTLAGVAWLAGLLLMHFLTTGQLVLTAQGKYVTLSLATLSGKVITTSKQSSVTERLHTGEYIASADGNSSGASEIVVVKAHHTARYELNVSATTGIEPVLSDTAASVAASPPRLMYLDGNGHLNQVAADGGGTILNTAVTFTDIRWAGPSFGVGTSVSGKLYVVSAGAVMPLQPPATSDGRPITAVSPDHEIYVALHRTLYRLSDKGHFDAVYTDGDDITNLYAGNNLVALVSAPDTSNESSSPSVTFWRATGRTTSRSMDVADLALSPGGSYVAIAGGDGGQIFNAAMKVVATIPQRTLTNPVWVNDTTLYYSVNDQLWSYDVLQQKSWLVANAPLGDPITELSVSSDRAYIYVGTTTSNGMQILKRVGLRGQKVPNVLYQLQDVLPDDEETLYDLGLINFGRLTVTVQPAAGVSASDALSAATTQLRQDGFNVNSFQIRVIQAGL